MKIKDLNIGFESTYTSSLEFDSSVTLSQSDTTTSLTKFSTSTPKKSLSYVELGDAIMSENVETELHSEEISNATCSTVATTNSSLLESSDIKEISNAELDNDVIEQLQIHSKRVWSKKYVQIFNCLLLLEL